MNKVLKGISRIGMLKVSRYGESRQTDIRYVVFDCNHLLTFETILKLLDKQQPFKDVMGARGWYTPSDYTLHSQSSMYELTFFPTRACHVTYVCKML